MRTNVVKTFSLETWGYNNIFVGGSVGSLLEELDIFQKTRRLDKKRLKKKREGAVTLKETMQLSIVLTS